MAKTVVVLGASITGIPIAHHLLKHTAPLVPGLKVILVSPNTSMYWNFATVRGLLPDTFPDDKLFFPIAPAFAKYSRDQFEFVVGKAEALDPSRKSVTVSTRSGEGRTISYDTLVIATGSSFRENLPFKNLASTEETKAALHNWQLKVKEANSIVVAGAGPTGVELAGELGYSYAQPGKKTITILANEGLPMSDRIDKDVRETAKKQLTALKVKFVGNAKVVNVRKTAGGQTEVEVSSPSGQTQTLTTDLFIPTYGVTPNSAFAPAHMVDSGGSIKQTTYLRAEGYDDIFVLGDVGSLQSSQAKFADDQVQHAAKALQAFLTGAAVPEYKPEPKVFMGVSVGPKGGTGQMGGFKPWSFMIWFFKARHLGTDYAADVVRGARTLQAKTWA